MTRTGQKNDEPLCCGRKCQRVRYFEMLSTRACRGSWSLIWSTWSKGSEMTGPCRDRSRKGRGVSLARAHRGSSRVQRRARRTHACTPPGRILFRTPSIYPRWRRSCCTVQTPNPSAYSGFHGASWRLSGRFPPAPAPTRCSTRLSVSKNYLNMQHVALHIVRMTMA